MNQPKYAIVHILFPYKITFETLNCFDVPVKRMLMEDLYG